MRRDLLVGLFVSLALAIFVAATVWLAGNQGSEPTTRYSIYFQKDVSGLMMGGPVFYLGVEVGTVTRMDIIPGDPMSVRVDIEVRESTPVDTGTTASLLFQGVTGVAVVNLTGEPGQNLPLKTPPGHEYPVIEVRDSGLAALLSGAPMLLDKVDALLDKASTLVSAENQASIAGTLQNIESVTTTLKSRQDDFANLPANLNATIQELRTLLGEFQTGAEHIRPELQATMSNIEQMSENLGSLTERLDQWTQTNNTDMSHFLDDGLGQVPALVSDARTTLRQLQMLLQELRENPSSLLYKSSDDSVPLEP
ncbi:MAG: MCE family protein [Xanthomonadales bacterium]|nr:MCE family protein [Xanthomonadales bacterium]NNL94494.1 MCE family protein [Xanthomonadales bacterium]